MDSTYPLTPAREAGPFTIGAVSEMTGVEEATLRVWERRYDFPRSTRSAGGHRLYAQRDVLRLRWVKLHMDMGMRAGAAIHAMRESRDSPDSPDTMRGAALVEPLPPCAGADAALRAAQSRLLTALLAYDSLAATSLLAQARAVHPIERITLDVIGPVLAAIGTAWSAGDVGIAAEHFATNFLRHQLLDWMSASPPPFDTPPIALACAPDELHEGSLLMLGVILRQMRWPVIYLGQSLTLADIGALVSRVHPALVVFVAMSEASARALAEWPRALGVGATPSPIVGYGGRAFNEHPELAVSVPGALLGATLCEGSQRINRYLLDLTVLGV